MLASGIAAASCGGARPDTGLAADRVSVVTAPAPSREERYCAWYGARGDDGVLYFGEAAFWSAMAAAGGDPTADQRRPGPQLVGRFDLARERMLPPLPVGGTGSRSGVWDVLFFAGGEVYFTTFFEGAGAVDPGTGRVRRIELGAALNELAEGPDETLLATRYGSGSADGGDGEVIAFARDGHLVQRWPLSAPPGYRVAPKTPAWDALRGELWVTADLLPTSSDLRSPSARCAPEGLPRGARPSGACPGAPVAQIRHDAYVAAASGAARIVAAPPELMFVAKARDGTLYFAEELARELSLRIEPPPGAGSIRSLVLDADFAAGHDFVQDIQPAADGRVVVTRWSGRVHVIDPDGSVRSAQLPRLDPDGLYYTGVLHGDRLCATYCADVTVVCIDAP